MANKKETKNLDAVLKAGKPNQYFNPIKRPYVTEKASLLAEKNSYVFEVDRKATKGQIKEAIESIYKVTVIKINIINLPARPKGWGRLEGSKKATSKAVVTVKEGQKIEIFG